MSAKTIVITGAPGSGKSSVINHLKHLGYRVFEEISRAITQKAQQDGIDQLFLSDPLKFSELLLEGRITQYNNALAQNVSHTFLDRGIPDVLAYLDYAQTSYSEVFKNACNNFRYKKIFILPPWKAIFKTDNERYENFEQATLIHEYLKQTYQSLKYTIIEVPLDTVPSRATFILKNLKLE